MSILQILIINTSDLDLGEHGFLLVSNMDSNPRPSFLARICPSRDTPYLRLLVLVLLQRLATPVEDSFVSLIP